MAHRRALPATAALIVATGLTLGAAGRLDMLELSVRDVPIVARLHHQCRVRDRRRQESMQGPEGVADPLRDVLPLRCGRQATPGVVRLQPRDATEHQVEVDSRMGYVRVRRTREVRRDDQRVLDRARAPETRP